jgi:hypothetical protein
MLQPLQDRLRRQQADPRRGQLDRQRQAIQPAHDLRDRGGVLLVNGETRQHGRRPLREQPHRFTRSDRRGRDGRLLGEGEGRDRALLLARHAKRRAAAHQDAEIAGAAQQFRYHRRGRQHVLEVVQDDQEPAVPQVMSQMLDERPALGIRQPDALGDRRQYQPGIPDRRQPDEVHPIGISAGHARGELDAKARLQLDDGGLGLFVAGQEQHPLGQAVVLVGQDARLEGVERAYPPGRREGVGELPER